jgi:putative transposase
MLFSLLYMVPRAFFRLAPAGERRDRMFLAAAARLLPKERWSCFIITPATLLGWHRQLVKRKWPSRRTRTGRAPLDPEIRQLIVRMAKDNPRWGYLRIQGELRKLGILVGATSIKRLLLRGGLGPAPRRGLSWGEFLRVQADGILACDFFTVETAFL